MLIFTLGLNSTKYAVCSVRTAQVRFLNGFSTARFLPAPHAGSREASGDGDAAISSEFPEFPECSEFPESFDASDTAAARRPRSSDTPSAVPASTSGPK